MDCLRNAAGYDPSWAEACNHYGNALREHGRLDEALEMYHRAKGLKSNYASPDYNIGLVSEIQGMPFEAEQSFRKALVIDPDFVPAWNSLGLLFHNQGKFSEAITCFHQSLQRDPNYLPALNNLGLSFLSQKNWEEAVAICRKAVALAPGCAEVHNTLGIALNSSGKKDEAIDCYLRALECNPDYADPHNNLAQIFIETGRLNDAEAHCRKALALRPSFPEALNNLGLAYKLAGRFPEAEECCRRSLELLPSNAEALNNLGIILRDRGNITDAQVSFESSVELQPGCAETWSNLGLIRRDQGDLEGAINCFRQSLKYRPDYPDTLNNLGSALTAQGKVEESLEYYRKAVTLDSGISYVHSSYLMMMLYSPHCTAEEIFKESLRWEELYGVNLRQKIMNTDNPLRKLRVGLVSPDFRCHSVSYFLRALLTQYSRDEMSITCYSDVPVADEYTTYFKSVAEYWRDTTGISDEEVARMVHDDKIDVLVDLAGHTSKRITLFTRRLAPVQVTWLGYPGTTGLSSIDYRLSDEIADPVGNSDLYHSEKIYRLPGGFLCYTAPEDAPVVAPLPLLGRNFLTFGSFNVAAKITPEVVCVWSNLLKRVPTSRLVMKANSLNDESTRQRYMELFAANGISSARVDLRSWEKDTKSHLSVYGEIDIALDSFPYNGTTTTCEALWMGVPVVTLLGERHAGRVGASILSRVGLEDLVAASHDEYISIAVALANDVNRLSNMRKNLRKNMGTSSLCNGAVFSRNIESAFRKMWRDRCLNCSQPLA